MLAPFRRAYAHGHRLHRRGAISARKDCQSMMFLKIEARSCAQECKQTKTRSIMFSARASKPGKVCVCHSILLLTFKGCTVKESCLLCAETCGRQDEAAGQGWRVFGWGGHPTRGGLHQQAEPNQHTGHGQQSPKPARERLQANPHVLEGCGWPGLCCGPSLAHRE